MKKLITLLLTIVCFIKVSNAQESLKVGQVLPNIALKSTSGLVYDLKAQKSAKGFIVVFITPTCDHCIAYEPRIMALDKKYKPKGFPVVAIGPYGDDAVKYPLDAMSEMKKLAVNKHFTFPYLSDEKFKYTWLLGIKKTPTAVVLKKEANGFVIKYVGRIDDNEDPNSTPQQKFVELEVNKLLK